MKGEAAHCGKLTYSFVLERFSLISSAGFPERAFAKHSSVLIEKGYKVARVEQTETPDMMEKRVKAKKGATKFDK
jgi:DNA mismatch repair ATPase MutS